MRRFLLLFVLAGFQMSEDISRKVWSGGCQIEFGKPYPYDSVFVIYRKKDSTLWIEKMKSVSRKEYITCYDNSFAYYVTSPKSKVDGECLYIFSKDFNLKQGKIDDFEGIEIDEGSWIKMMKGVNWWDTVEIISFTRKGVSYKIRYFPYEDQKTHYLVFEINGKIYKLTDEEKMIRGIKYTDMNGDGYLEFIVDIYGGWETGDYKILVQAKNENEVLIYHSTDNFVRSSALMLCD
jgi:hypothetical protein